MSVKLSNPKDIVGTKKSPLSVVPMNVVAELGLAMLEGASKYGRHNYRGCGVRASVYFDATMRHLIAWWEGETIDPDSGMSHITKAIASLTVLRDAQMQGMCEDDRPPSSVNFYGRLNEGAASIIEQHKDKNPRHWTINDSPEPIDAPDAPTKVEGCKFMDAPCTNPYLCKHLGCAHLEKATTTFGERK